MEVSGSDGKKFLWEVVDDHVVEEGKEHNDIGLWGFDFILFGEDGEGVVIKLLSEYPYLLMLTNYWPGRLEE